MRLRVGLVAGFAAGAYVATIAQRRSRQLSQQLKQKADVTAHWTVKDATGERAKAALGSALARVRGSVAAKLGDPAGARPAIEAPSALAAHQHNGGRST